MAMPVAFERRRGILIGRLRPEPSSRSNRSRDSSPWGAPALPRPGALGWRRLPGPWPTRVGLLALVAAAVIVLLFAVVFPWLEPRLPFNQVTVGDGAAVPWDHGSGGGWGQSCVRR